MQNLFNIEDQVVIITGGAGFIGKQFAEAILANNGIPVLLDIDGEKLEEAANLLRQKHKCPRLQCYQVDITKRQGLKDIKDKLIKDFGKIDALVNNAAINPKMNVYDEENISLESLTEEAWDFELDVGLKGSWNCSVVFGSQMALQKSPCSIVNIASDLAIISPDQRIYKNNPNQADSIKPITYSIVKTGLIGMTRYLATYWAQSNVRVNALSPGGMENGQNESMVQKICERVPMARMARNGEYCGALIFLLSNASAYMTGHNMVIDGGRTVW